MSNDQPDKAMLDSLKDGSVFFCGRHLMPPLDPEPQKALENLRLIPDAPANGSNAALTAAA
jgi:hypothetical protein